MSPTPDQFAKTFSLMGEGELLRLAAESKSISRDACGALANELLQRAKIELNEDAPQLTQRKGISGWVHVRLPRFIDTIFFPTLCPNCLRSDAFDALGYNSNSHRKFGFLYTRHEFLSIEIPHCFACNKIVTNRRRNASVGLTVVGIILITLALLAGITVRVPIMFLMILSIPVGVYVRRVESVAIGDYDDTFIDFKFKMAEYAEVFSQLNHISVDTDGQRKSTLLYAYSKVLANANRKVE